MATSSMYPTSVTTTQIWDVSQLHSVDVTSPEFKELLVRMYQQINLMANVVNYKDTGLYQNAYEIVNGQQWFPNPANNSGTATNPTLRPVFRTVVNFGALPNNGAKSVNHNINPNTSFSFTRIYGAASKQTAPFDYVPIPNVAPSIEIDVTATQVTVTDFMDMTAYNAYIILEYIKN